MSMTTELIDRLKKYALFLEDTSTNGGNTDLRCVKAMRGAAETIEELSAKLRTANMERSNQYYHGGWIPVDERLPEENGTYLVSYEDSITLLDWFNGKWFFYRTTPSVEESGTIIAWRPLPEPYQPNDVEAE